MTNSETTSRAGPARRVHAAAHRFAEGQTVRLKNAFIASGNVYAITASLPPLGVSPQYRIRSAGETFERMATEAELELVSAPAPDRRQRSAERLFDHP